jgi:hypothetical protein
VWKLTANAFLLSAAVMACVLMFSAVGLAQDAANAAGQNGGLDLTPITEPLLELAGVFLTVVLGWGLKRLALKFDLSINENHLKVVDFVAQKGVDLARQKIAGTDGKVTAKIKDRVIREAITHLVAGVPDALKHFKIEPGTTDGDAKIRRLIEARLPADSEADAATSPEPAAATA